MTMNKPSHRAEVSRRSFLRQGTAAVAGMAALVAALSPLKDFDFDEFVDINKFLQKHYKELSPEEMQKVLDRISADVEKRYQVRPDLRDYKAMDGVEFVYALNLSRCIGCRKCVHACVVENNLSREPEIQYIRVLEMPRGTIDIERGNHIYERTHVPDKDHFYMPIQCHQCSKPACTKVCPIEATWKDEDGIVVVDYDWCIGCRYCEAACPYWARRFNFAKPKFPVDENGKAVMNPHMSYLGNRPRAQGVMEKCHFCIQRTRAGQLPACLEVCPVGARKFGDVKDPESEVAQILKTKRIFVLKEELKTYPRFFYYFDERHPQVGTSGEADLSEIESENGGAG